jgi:hypothetical protein
LIVQSPRGENKGYAKEQVPPCGSKNLCKNCFILKRQLLSQRRKGRKENQIRETNQSGERQEPEYLMFFLCVLGVLCAKLPLFA